MKKVIVLAAAIAIACSCQIIIPFQMELGNGTSVNVAYNLPEFDEVDSSGSLDVYYTQTPGNQSVILTTDENLVEFYDISVTEGVLHVSVKQGVSIKPKSKSYLAVSSSEISSINLSGSGDCRINGDITVGSNVRIRLNGSGDFETNGRMKCKDMFVTVYGSGDINMHTAEADHAKFTVSGSGDIKLDTISALKIFVGIYGSGDGRIGCQDAGDIDLRVFGSGDIHISGSARTLKSRISGSGRINSKDLTLESEAN